MARQIFAMFEQRVARHLEARARQAAGLVVRAQIHMENNEEADQGQPEINNEGGPQEIINREQSDAEEETDNFVGLEYNFFQIIKEFRDFASYLRMRMIIQR
jgi:hypothetical protein